MESGPDRAVDAKRTPWLLPLLALVAWAFLVARFDFVCDDAYISFRYARHLLEGQGLRFNLGESPPVEGYTNLLWVLWIAAAKLLGVDARSPPRRLGRLWRGADRPRDARRVAALLPRSPSAILVGLFLACLPPVAMWSTGGLETMPFAFAVFGVWERLAGDPDRPRAAGAAVCAAAAALLRADGALWVAFSLAAALATPASDPRALRRAVLRALALLAAVVVAHVLWRRAYHGD